MAVRELTPTQKAAVRRHVADFCLRAENARLQWRYDEVRPFVGFGDVPEDEHVNDCSGYCSLAFDWAARRTSLDLDDPLGEQYTGWGNTDTQYAFLKGHPVSVDRYLVGDMALFGSPGETHHVSICRKPGTRATAIFSSNGHESPQFGHDAPNPTTLDFTRLVGVYRHPGLA
jgi:hypothetical protein